MTLQEALKSARLANATDAMYELWTADGRCIARRYSTEIKPELTEGLRVGQQRSLNSSSGSYIIRVQ